MTDKELLELAAKAMGYKISNRLTGGGLMVITNERPSPHKWNPLVNGNDTIQIINRFHMKVIVDLGYTLVQSDTFCADEYNGSDKDKAFKRAVTRVAADIGGTL